MVTYCILFLMPDVEFEDFNPMHKLDKLMSLSQILKSTFH